MYAIVETGGKQIKVAPGDKISVELLPGSPETTVVLDRVLMISKDDLVTFGSPYVQGAQVSAEIVASGRKKKVVVMKHVPKKAHEKMTGHRQHFTMLKIKEIVGG